jgi:voltage-gated potassium channel
MAGSRRRGFTQLHPLAWSKRGLSPANKLILTIVVLSILSAVLESEPEIRGLGPGLFHFLNILFATAFAVEYGVRMWAMGEDARYAGFVGRVRYFFAYATLIDLVATVALWIDILFGVPGVYGVLLRLVRVLRVLTLTRNSEWASAIRLLARAIGERRFELSLSLGFAGLVLVVSATLLFAVEGEVQPEGFGSIPRAMWWAMATLTTVGYGDVYPITGLGKFCASIAVLTSIAIVAMPTGIMAAAFSSAFQRLRDAPKNAG